MVAHWTTLRRGWLLQFHAVDRGLKLLARHSSARLTSEATIVVGHTGLWCTRFQTAGPICQKLYEAIRLSCPATILVACGGNQLRCNGRAHPSCSQSMRIISALKRKRGERI